MSEKKEWFDAVMLQASQLIPFLAIPSWSAYS
jgi:hypothetical protein